MPDVRIFTGTVRRHWPRLIAWASCILAVLLLGLYLCILAPVPHLPPPDGPFALGTRVYRWTDMERAEDATSDPTDRRSVIVQAWYPASLAADKHSAYMDGLGHLPPHVGFLPRWFFHFYGHINTHAATSIPLSSAKPRWPVLIFSPGYGAPRAVYTGLITQIASRGFIVFAVDHPYEAAVTQLPDGRIATTVEHFDPKSHDRSGFMVDHLATRAADIRFLLDQLQGTTAFDPGFASRLDLEHIGVIGHSFGGATAAVAAWQDPRVKAAANIDGTLYGDVRSARIATPFLLLQSDPTETHHGQPFLDGNQRLLNQLQARSYHYTLRHANHYSFTDVPFFLAPPGRWLLSRIMGGSRGPAETQQISADLLCSFLEQAFTAGNTITPGSPSKWPGVEGGAVRKN